MGEWTGPVILAATLLSLAVGIEIAARRRGKK